MVAIHRTGKPRLCEILIVYRLLAVCALETLAHTPNGIKASQHNAFYQPHLLSTVETQDAALLYADACYCQIAFPAVDQCSLVIADLSSSFYQVTPRYLVPNDGQE